MKRGDGERVSVGLAHDYLLVMRGAERTFAEIASCWPDAPIYTALYSPSGTWGRFEGREITTSYLQRLPVAQRGFRRLMPLYPRAIERLPVAGHDVIVSSSSAFAHGVRPRGDAVHVCYCHSPFRYAWHERDRALAEAPALLRPLLRRQLDRVRTWDQAAAQRVDAYIANSRLTQQRIADAYGREAEVVHPPVDTESLAPGVPGEEFLLVSELVGHKRIEVALEAVRRAGARVTVVGEGPAGKRLAREYGGAAEFAGRVGDERLRELYASCRALIVPAVEEFGIVAVEAQAAGRPVIAVDAGGARETVLDGETGVLVPEGDTAALTEVIAYTDFDRFLSSASVENAARFSARRFRERLRSAVGSAAA